MLLKVVKKQNNSSMCVICGLTNEFSLKCGFYELEDGTIATRFIAHDVHQSYPERMHGGMISALLDEICGRAVNVRGADVWGVTGELTVRFKKPVPLNTELVCVGKCVKDSGKIFYAEGFIEDKDGRILATARATYVKMPVELISSETLNDNNWFLQKDAVDVKEMEIKNIDYFNT